MEELNQILYNPTKVNANCRVYTKEAWDSAINSELNQCKAIPVVLHPNTESFEVPLDATIGMADLAWDENNNIKVHMVLAKNNFKDISFVPAFEADNINTIDSIDYISSCDIKYFFATDKPAFEIKHEGN